jgi:small conductance mechanosensitive channel
MTKKHLEEDVMKYVGIVIEKLTEFSTTYGLQILGAIAILVLGRWMVKLLTRATLKVLEKTIKDPILVRFLGSLVHALLLIIVVMAALSNLGINTTSLVAILGAAGLAVGLALQGSLSNFGSGVLLLVFRPYSKGDYVEAGGSAGSVEELTIFNTVLKTPDNKIVIVPNAKITNDNITNYSRKSTRRVDFTFGVGYSDDLKKVRQVLAAVLETDERIEKEPEPFIAVGELADSSVNFVVRVWVKTADFWNVFFDITEKVKLAFDENGISIPFPQLDLHLPDADLARLNPGA